MQDQMQTLPTGACDTPDAPIGTPKWAAIVEDVLIPLPRRSVKARVILAQAGKEGHVLVRDYDQPADVALDPDAEIDLAEGNVFRVVSSCDAPPAVAPAAPAKLAFVIDDAWEVTINPHQTRRSLIDLFGLPDDAELFRDFMSPNDQRILPSDAIRFADGPVFRVQFTHITVKVNNNPVEFHKRRETGLQIKTTAIAQGVVIQPGFNLYPSKPDGSLGPVILDDEPVTLKCGDEFTCTAPDDNS